MHSEMNLFFFDNNVCRREDFDDEYIGCFEPNNALARAKVNPRPWNWEKSHEMGYCYPVGDPEPGSGKSHLTKA